MTDNEKRLRDELLSEMGYSAESERILKQAQQLAVAREIVATLLLNGGWWEYTWVPLDKHQPRRVKCRFCHKSTQVRDAYTDIVLDHATDCIIALTEAWLAEMEQES